MFAALVSFIAVLTYIDSGFACDGSKVYIICDAKRDEIRMNGINSDNEQNLTGFK